MVEFIHAALYFLLDPLGPYSQRPQNSWPILTALFCLFCKTRPYPIVKRRFQTVSNLTHLVAVEIQVTKYLEWFQSKKQRLSVDLIGPFNIFKTCFLSHSRINQRTTVTLRKFFPSQIVLYSWPAQNQTLAQEPRMPSLAYSNGD